MLAQLGHPVARSRLVTQIRGALRCRAGGVISFLIDQMKGPGPMLHRLILACALVFGALSATAQGFDTRAKAAYIYDVSTGTVLLAKDADTPLPPASMSKLMTVYMAFEAISDGRLSPQTKLPVSEHAMSYGGSTMFLDTTDRVSVEDLLRGVIVLSGNDASAVLAEALSPDGTEAGFARLMTQRAKQLGMMNSTFTNSNGWPSAGHRMSVRDLGLLAQHLIEDFPTYYPLFSEAEFQFDGRAPQNIRNRNPLLGLGIGADGLKTGHTEAAGYGLVGSAKQGDRRVIFVLSGMSSTQERAEEAERVVNWAFRQFSERSINTTDTALAEMPVFMGAQPSVGLSLKEDLRLLVPAVGNINELKAEAVFSGPVTAPVTKGDELGELVITLDGLPEIRRPLVAAQDVAKGGFGPRLRSAVTALQTRFLSPAAPANDA